MKIGFLVLYGLAGLLIFGYVFSNYWAIRKEYRENEKLSSSKSEIPFVDLPAAPVVSPATPQ